MHGSDIEVSRIAMAARAILTSAFDRANFRRRAARSLATMRSRIVLPKSNTTNKLCVNAFMLHYVPLLG